MSLFARQGSKLRSPLAQRFVLGIVLASSAIILMLTATQIYFDYRSEVGKIDRLLRQIEDVHLKPLTQSSWAANSKDLQLQVEGIIRIGNVELVEVREGSNVVATAGRRASSELVERQYPMTYVYRDKAREIGTLTVMVGLDPIYRQLWREALGIFISNATVISLMAVFAFLLFDRLVNRPLLQIATYMNARELTMPMSPLTLKRPVQSRPDEFDELVTAINLDGSRIMESRVALQKSGELFDSIVEHIPVMVFVKRASDLRFERFNLYGEKLLGYSRNDLIGKSDYDLWPKAQADDLVALDRKTLASSEVTEIPNEAIKNASGETRYLHTWKTVLRDEGGKPTHLLGISLDITERIQSEVSRASLEAQLRESQKMQAIGTLAGGIAHDFNNILAAILGNTQLAREDSIGNAAALQSLEEIRKAGTRARDLVKQILSFSRRQPTDRRRIALTHVVEESAQLLRATLPPRIALQVRYGTAAPEVLADATQIQQLIINLATNALQAMSEGAGSISIDLDTIVLDAAQVLAQPQLDALHEAHRGRTVRLSVSDSGPGMDAAMLERIFEPFFTTKAPGEGTGLGLSVVHGIVQGHEGGIVVDSAPGEGTTFCIYLPAAEEAAEVVDATVAGKAAEGAPALHRDSGQHIFYLDDEEALVLLVKRLLERRGYRVSGYVQQDEALAALRANPLAFDLVLTDYNMPGMSGLDVAREARSIRADLPVAIASGFLDETLRAEAAKVGVRDIIFKAIEIDEFCTAVQAVAASAKAS